MRFVPQPMRGQEAGRQRSHPVSYTSRRGRSLTLFSLFLPLAVILHLTGCALSSSLRNPAPPPAQVTLTPANVFLFLGQSQQFSATVTNAASTAVNWSVNGISGGNSTVGTIVPASFGAVTATYTAPQIMPSSASINITATSQADLTASASASVQIQSNLVVSIAPTSASLAINASQSFTATVSGSGSPNIAVTWSVNGVPGGNLTVGSIVSTSAGSASYTAPAAPPPSPTVSVTATSVADPTKSVSASVTITCFSSSLLSPATVNVSTGSTQNFSASLCVAPNAAVAWDVNGIAGGNSMLGTISPSSSNSSAAMYTAPAAVPATNPLTVHARANSQLAFATVTVVAPPPITVTVSPSSASVPAGQHANFTASVSGTSDLAVT